MTRRWILILYIVPALLLAAGTILFLFTDLDLRLELHFYNESAELWTAAADQPWASLYKFGVVPAIVTALFAFCFLMLGIGRPKVAAYRKIATFLLLALVVGPGLVANAVLKDHWGRPRPREVIEFGGEHNFEKLLTIDSSSDGKSFVCGHATMGFYFFGAGLLFCAAGRRKTGAVVILAAAGYGTLIGIARMAAGGHFGSDVLWAAGVVWFTSAGLFHAFHFHHNVLYEPAKPVGTKIPAWVPPLTLVGLLLIIGTTSLAWPYSRDKSTTLLPESVTLLPDTIHLTLDLEGTLEIARGEELTFVTESRGFGFPKSKLSNNRLFIENGSKITHARQGYFTELNVRSRLTLPANRVYLITLTKRLESVYLSPPDQFDSESFAHVRLTAPSGIKLKSKNPDLKAKVVDEDFFGRKTRAFSF